MKMLRFTLTLLVFSLIIISMTSCGGNKPSDDTDDPGSSATDPGSGDLTSVGLETHVIQTEDGFTISADFMGGEGDGPHPAVLLLHMLGKDKSDYELMQVKLSGKGISSLAIDLRGHGESMGDGTLDYQSFTIDEWQAVINDIAAGYEFLLNRPEVINDQICIIGASIGANMAAEFTADQLTSGIENPPAMLVLLSPGRNYKDYQPLDRARDLRGIPVYIVSSQDDGGSYETSQALSQATGGDFVEFDGDTHGTDLFLTHPELVDDIAAWLNNNFANIPLKTDDSPTSIDEAASMDDASEGGQ